MNLSQLLTLFLDRFGVREHLPKFLAVGLVGIGVDCVCFYLVLHVFTPDVLVAQVFSFLIALTHNFLLNRFWTFKDLRSAHTLGQYCKFFVVACLALGLRSGVIAICLRWGSPPFLSLMAGIGSGTAVNFVGSREWAFADQTHWGWTSPAGRTSLIVAFMCFLIVLRVVYAGLIELSPEEAYYWLYSQHPALSYFDHPPMVAWVVWLGTALLGQTELGVRACGLALSFGSTALIYLLGSLWFGKRSGLVAALFFLVIPLYFIYGFTITPDLPLFFFWLATLYFLTKALQQKKNWAWYAAGISAGAAMLSKYPAVILVPCAFLLVLLHRPYRIWRGRKEPYLALLICLLVFSPVIIWNCQHEWASFGFQVVHRLATQASPPLVTLLEFYGGQLGVLFPFFALGLLGTLLLSLHQTWKRKGPRWQFSFLFSFPLLVLFSLASLRTETKVNWPLPAYLSLLIALYPWYRAVRRRVKGTLRTTFRHTVCASVFLVTVVLMAFLYHLGIGIPHFPDIGKLGGWRELGKAVAQQEAAMEAETGTDPFLMGLSKYYISAELAFYTGEPHDTFSLDLVGGKSLAFRYWTDREALRSRDALVIGHQPPSLDFLRNFFSRVDTAVTKIDIVKQGIVTDAFYLVRCYGFLG